VPRPPTVIELVGPAGVGKTTLALQLEAQGKAVLGSMWEVPTVLLARSAIRQLSEALALYRETGVVAWDEVKHFARLDALHASLVRPGRNGHRLVVLDEGPVYTLSWLQVIGHQRLRNGGAKRWWWDTLRRWARTLDAVVLLDAPDPVLASRIRERDKPHLMKDRSLREIAGFSAAYRAATDRVLAGLTACGGPPLLTLETSDEPSERLSERLLAALEVTVPAR